MNLWGQVSAFAGAGDRTLSFANGETYSYRDFFARVDQMRGALTRHVAPGEIVLMDGVKSYDAICALLACVKLGCGYSFLDISLPVKRRAQIIKAIQPAVYLSANQGPFLSQLHQKDVDSGDRRSFTGSIVFTSGSTGAAKGVFSSFDALAHYVDSMLDVMGTEQDTWLSICPVHFDVVQLDVFVQLSRGANIIFAEHTLLPQQYMHIIEKQNVTSVLFISTLLKMLCQVSPSAPLNKLRKIYFGGEGCAVQVLEKAMALFPDVEFCQFYGPTENCNNTTSFKFNALRDTETGFMPLGAPIKHVTIDIVDDTGAPCSAGEVGEVIIGGRQLFDGYLDVATGDFRAHTGPYESNDLAYRDAEGLIWFVGRNDDLVKVNGNRVSLNEISSKIRELVTSATVLTIAREKSGFQILIAGVHSSRVFETQDVIDHLKASLPTYSVPSKVFALPDDVVTTTSTGKTNYKAIKEFLLMQT